ncbi:MAG: DUF3240 family protein [Pseudomonadota bacterium]
METHDAQRVEIIIEATMERRLSDVLLEADVTGFTILPVHGGSGRSGHWTRDGEISRASGMVSVICLVREDRVDHLLDSVFAVLKHHIGVVSVTDAKVLRAERF